MMASPWVRWTGWALSLLVLASCASGPVRRVSEPSARIQQLTVAADGQWSIELRIENFSSIPMRFDAIDVALTVNDQEAGTLTAQPAVTVGPESADAITLQLTPSVAAKLAVADALSGRRSLAYSLEGTATVTPEDERQRQFRLKRSSALSPAPGLPGVMR